MKLLTHITLRISLFLLIVMTLWACLFYTAIINEINDEVDDSLEDYSEMIITRKLAGESVPEHDNGTNNTFFIRKVTEEYMYSNLDKRYSDSMIYIREKKETEPARILKTFYRNADDELLELTVLTPTIEKSDLKKAILEWILWLYLSLLILIVLINVGLIKHNMKPLYILLKWLDKYQMGGVNEPLNNSTDIVEFRKLNDAALRNAKRGEMLFEEQKQFIGNASHEIQTPIAICRNRLEMLLEDESLGEKQIGEVIKVIQTLDSITRLNKSLLLLSKIENHQFIEKESLCINTIVKNLLTDFEEAYSYKNISTEVIERERLEIVMNNALASVLITNLIKNAYVHNVEGGTIQIKITNGSLILANTGASEPLDSVRIFDRFYHTKKKENSSGLGLAIVESICKIEGFSCNYAYKDGLHQFFLHFTD
ncbi:MAG: sensor histidine kinase [Bacteroidales bacterium]